MIELTDDQIQSLTTSEDTPPRALNPKTNETFVLLSITEYERLKADDDFDDSPWTPEELAAAAAEIAEATDWAVIEDDEESPHAEKP